MCNSTKKQIKKITDEEEQYREFEDETSSDGDFLVNHLHKVLKVEDSGGKDSKLINIQIEDVDIRAEPDSRADVNLMDAHQYKALTNR